MIEPAIEIPSLGRPEQGFYGGVGNSIRVWQKIPAQCKSGEASLYEIHIRGLVEPQRVVVPLEKMEAHLSPLQIIPGSHNRRVEADTLILSWEVIGKQPGAAEIPEWDFRYYVPGAPPGPAAFRKATAPPVTYEIEKSAAAIQGEAIAIRWLDCILQLRPRQEPIYPWPEIRQLLRAGTPNFQRNAPGYTPVLPGIFPQLILVASILGLGLSLRWLRGAPRKVLLIFFLLIASFGCVELYARSLWQKLARQSLVIVKEETPTFSGKSVLFDYVDRVTPGEIYPLLQESGDWCWVQANGGSQMWLPKKSVKIVLAED